MSRGARAARVRDALGTSYHVGAHERPKPVPAPLRARGSKAPSPPPGWVGQVTAGVGPARDRGSGTIWGKAAEASACVLLPVSLQEQLHARHVSRKNPQNPCSDRELRLTPDVCGSSFRKSFQVPAETRSPSRIGSASGATTTGSKPSSCSTEAQRSCGGVNCQPRHKLSSQFRSSEKVPHSSEHHDDCKDKRISRSCCPTHPDGHINQIYGFGATWSTCCQRLFDCNVSPICCNWIKMAWHWTLSIVIWCWSASCAFTSAKATP